MHTPCHRTCRGKVVARSKTDKGKDEGGPDQRPSLETESVLTRLGKLRPISQWRFPGTIVVLFS